MNKWLYCREVYDETPSADAFGFIYLITNLKTDQKYVGKKQFWSNRTKKVVGKKNRKHFKKESDWRNYWGSSEEFTSVVAAEGKENFRRDIIKICETKGQQTYAEIEYQIKNDVLTRKLPNGLFEYYNLNILARWFRKKPTS